MIELVEIEGKQYEKITIDKTTVTYRPVVAVVKRGRPSVKQSSDEPKPSPGGDGVPSS